MKSEISSSVFGRFAVRCSDASLFGAWRLSKVGGMK